MSARLGSKVAIVTGSTGGLGEGIARAMAAAGAAVVVAGRRSRQGAQVADEINANGGRAVFVQADIVIESDCARLVQAALDHFGRLDVLVNNAGLFPKESFEGMTLELWDQVFAVNVRGAFFCSRHAIPALRRQGGGSIINIGSTMAWLGTMERLAYSCSKGALLTMTKALARGLLADRIRVNWVTVGWVATPGEISLRDHTHGDGLVFLEGRGRQAPLGRLETVEETAAGVVYLASDDASHVTGCELNISGGLWI